MTNLDSIKVGSWVSFPDNNGIFTIGQVMVMKPIINGLGERYVILYTSAGMVNAEQVLEIRNEYEGGY